MLYYRVSVCLVCADHVEHVFHNYLANAIKHVKEKGQIKVGLKKKGDKVRLSVYNDGPQIPDKNKDKIWMEFVSFNKNISKNSSGLGLYIVQEISILYETECGYNNYDQGVEFWFDFVDFSIEE